METTARMKEPVGRIVWRQRHAAQRRDRDALSSSPRLARQAAVRPSNPPAMEAGVARALTWAARSVSLCLDKRCRMLRTESDTANWFILEQAMRWAFSSTGGAYRGFFLHDDRDQTATLRVVFSESDSVDVRCDRHNSTVRDSGLHSTGNCGFTFPKSLMERITQADGCEIYEVNSGILLHRQHAEMKYIQSKAFVYQSPIDILHPYLEALVEQHVLPYNQLEGQSRETIINILNTSNANSIAITGEIDWERYETFIRRSEFVPIIFLVRPERFLARHIVRILEYFELSQDDIQKEQHENLYTIGEQLSDIDFEDEDTLATWETYLSPATLQYLRNPMIHHITAAPLGRSITPVDFSTALSIVGRFDLIGTEDTEELFLASVADALDVSLDAGEDFPRTGDIDDPLVEAIMATEGVRKLTRIDRKFYDICTMGLTDPRPDVPAVLNSLMAY
ncbi:hypothetical protein [Mesorhizobium sp. IMUNJ 23232]|uniref:hypothetical protein n=1 Tax=Mesorhizobium sp. IMUNJ 23232 TaxID=3376064 RepID=UPI00378B4F06